MCSEKGSSNVIMVFFVKLKLELVTIKFNKIVFLILILTGFTFSRVLLINYLVNNILENVKPVNIKISSINI